MMTMTADENHILHSFRNMTDAEQKILDHVATLIVRERLVTDQTVAAMTEAIKTAYKKSATIATKNFKIIGEGQTIDGMNRDHIKCTSIYR